MWLFLTKLSFRILNSRRQYNLEICVLLIISCIDVIAVDPHDDPCLVTAPVGIYRGFLNASILYPQSVYCNFLGIKYAEAMGNHRFGKPLPVEPLGPGEIYDAFSYGDSCPQITLLSTRGQMSEDCLTLNVFTPKVYSEVKEPLRAVIVYIHGGAFVNGGSREYRPDYLVPQNVVLVTVNYRLDAFGFLNLNMSECPGNMGLWDQNQALKWIRNNIASFGGDRDRITLHGQSAGAVSVYLHILSPQSQDLFQRAIIHSPVTTYKFVKSDTVSKSIAYARSVGCPFNMDRRDEILRCLQRKSIDQLMRGSMEFIAMLDIIDETFRNRGPPFWPSEDVWQEHPFLPSTSLEVLGMKAPNVDVIMGQLSADAGVYFLMLDNWDVVAEVQKNLHVYLGKESMFVKDERVQQAVVDKVNGYYFNESNADNALDATQKLLLDLTYYNWYTETISNLNLSYHNGKVRIYQFQVDDYQIMKKSQFKEDYRLVEGAAHGEDLAYLFGYMLSFISFSNYTMTKNQFRVVREMTTYWTNFAKSGNPNCECDNDTLVEWKPILPFPAKPNYLLIGNETTVFVEGKRIEHKRREFWDKLRTFAARLNANGGCIGSSATPHIVQQDAGYCFVHYRLVELSYRDKTYANGIIYSQLTDIQAQTVLNPQITEL